jgi:hypothetical protein
LRTGAVEINARLRDLGFPGRWGVLICKTYTELADRVVRDIQKELCGAADLGRIRNTKTGGWFFEFHDPSLGGFYLRNVGDNPDEKRGIQYDWMGFDELTQIQKREYDALKYTLRSGDALPFKTFFAASNPDGIGHGWCKRYWIERDFTDEEHLVKQGLLYPDDFVFIPARATDNPAFDTSIQATLMGFEDPMMIKARWEGSWDLTGGLRFSQFNRGVHTFEWGEFEQYYGRGYSRSSILNDIDLMYVYGSLDYGTDVNSASAFYLHAVDTRGRVWTFLELYMQGAYLDVQAELIKEACAPYRIQGIYCDPKLNDRESDGISRFYKFRERGVHLTPGINSRVEGWSTLDALLNYRRLDDGELIKPPQWRIHHSCRHLTRFLTSAPRDDLRPEDVSHKYRDDHAGDSARYMMHSYFKRPPQIADNGVGGFTAQWIKEQINANKRNKRGSEPRWF